MRRIFFAALLALASSTAAQATTIDFKISDLGTTEATGSFSYTSPNPILSYSDLTDFSLMIASANYKLPFVQSSTNYDYFQFDTATQTFVSGDASGTYGTLGPFLLSAFANNLSSGFDFFAAPRDDFSELTQGIYDMPYDNVVVMTVRSTDPVPEPSSLPMLLAGLGIIAGALGLKRMKGRRASEFSFR